MPQHKGISSKTYKPQSGRDRLYFNFSMSASYLKWRSTGAVSVSVAPVSIELNFQLHHFLVYCLISNIDAATIVWPMQT